jgi:hypothetical protein
MPFANISQESILVDFRIFSQNGSYHNQAQRSLAFADRDLLLLDPVCRRRRYYLVPRLK